MNDKRYFGESSIDRIEAESLYEAIEEFIEDMAGTCLPEKVVIKEYKCIDISREKLNPLEIILERLDEDYGDPEDWGIYRPSESLKEAEQVFIDAVLDEYVPWQMEEVESHDIDLNKIVQLTADCSRNGCKWEVTEGIIKEVDSEAMNHSKNFPGHWPFVQYDWKE